MGNLCQLGFHRDIEKGFWEGGLFFLFIYRLEISCWEFYERYSLFNRKISDELIFNVDMLSTAASLLSPLVGFAKLVTRYIYLLLCFLSLLFSIISPLFASTHF